MKYLKIPVLCAVAAIGLMAFAGSASAGSFTVNHVVATPDIKSVSTHAVLHLSPDLTCEGATLDVDIQSHGAGVTAKGPSDLNFVTCGSSEVVVSKGGTVEFHTHPNDAGGSSGNATITMSGSEFSVKLNSIFGTITCIFTTNNTDIGTFRGATSTSGHAAIEINGTIPRTGGSSLCGSSGQWTATYHVSSPTGIRYH